MTLYKQGTYGAKVKQIQELLKELGHYHGYRQYLLS